MSPEFTCCYMVNNKRCNKPAKRQAVILGVRFYYCEKHFLEVRQSGKLKRFNIFAKRRLKD